MSVTKITQLISSKQVSSELAVGELHGWENTVVAQKLQNEETGLDFNVKNKLVAVQTRSCPPVTWF